MNKTVPKVIVDLTYAARDEKLCDPMRDHDIATSPLEDWITYGKPNTRTDS